MLLNLLISSLLIALTTASAIPSFFEREAPLSAVNVHSFDPASLNRRQASSGRQNTTSSASRLEATTLQACTDTLSTLGKPTSPSGISLCYNVPFLNITTGVFRADLRLFGVALPRESWANVSSRDMVPSVQWRGAAVRMIDTGKRHVLEDDDQEEILLERRDSGLGKREAGDTFPKQMLAYTFIGQISADMMAKALNSSMLQSYLLPMVSLSAESLNSTLPTTEASFLALASPQLSTAVFTPLITPPFVLPGTKIAQVPIGGIIAGIWALLLVGLLGWGGVERMKFREQYRRRVAIDKARAAGSRRL